MYENKRLSIVELIFSVLLIICGVFTLTRPAAAIGGPAIVYGILAIATGVMDIVIYAKLERHTGFGPATALVTGILSAIAGVLILIEPSIGAITLVWIFPIWFICHCISRLTRLDIIRAEAGKAHYYFSLIVNVLGLVVGIMMLFNPYFSFISLSWFVGFYLILLGVDGISVPLSALFSH